MNLGDIVDAHIREMKDNEGLDRDVEVINAEVNEEEQFVKVFLSNNETLEISWRLPGQSLFTKEN